MKEKLVHALGFLGIIVYYLFCLAVFLMPFFAIDVKKWVAFLLICVQWFIPESSIIFWIWGLVSVIKWHSGTLATVYYIMTVIIFLPFFISLIFDFIGKLSNKD